MGQRAIVREQFGFNGIGRQIEEGDQGVPESPGHFLERLEIGIELAAEIAAHPRLVLVDAGGQFRLRDLGRRNPRLDPIPRDLVKGLRHRNEDRRFH
jgi:hypothetical protein